MRLSRYRIRILIDIADDDGWQLVHEGGGESDRLSTIVTILEATASSIEGGTIVLEEE